MMIFEDILQDVGGFGPYQKVLVAVFLFPATMVIPWFSMNSIFLASTPDHWCRPPPEVAHSNLSLEQKRRLVSPPGDPRCSMHDIDYQGALRAGNYTPDPLWPTKGCEGGWEYDTTNYEATSVTRWNLVCKDDYFSSLVVSLMFIGITIGTPLFGYMSDRVGRKPTFLLTAFVIGVTDIGSTLSPDFTAYLVLRTINGLCITTIYALPYIILLELVMPEQRAGVNGLASTAWTLGMCVLPLVAWLTRSWLYLSAVTSAASLALCLYWRVIPESPSWLISQGRYKEAHEILVRVSKGNSKNFPETELLMEKIHKLGEELKSQKEKEKKASPFDFLRYPKLRKRFILITICWISGYVPYYGHQMNARNLAGNEFLNFLYLAAVEMPATLAAWWATEAMGRRWCAMASFLLATAACFLPIICPPGYPMVGVAAALLAKGGISAAYMTVYIIAPEIFPTSHRALGMGLCSTIGMGSSLVGPYIVYLSKFGTTLPFVCFAAISLLGLVSALFLPETLDLPLPQTVADVESFRSNRSFWACGSVEDAEPEETSAEKPRLTKCNNKKWTPVESKSIYKKRGSVDSLGGIYVIPLTAFKS